MAKGNKNPDMRGINAVAADCLEKPVPISVTIEPSQVELLDSLEGGRSLHVRIALRIYEKMLAGKENA